MLRSSVTYVDCSCAIPLEIAACSESQAKQEGLMRKRRKNLKHFLVALGACLSILAVPGALPLVQALPAFVATSVYIGAPRTHVVAPTLPAITSNLMEVSASNTLPADACAAGGASAEPATKGSWLIDILDRSGSLGGPSGTDPQDYSVSVTKLLATLWGGTMEVVILSGDAPRLTTLGPYDLSQGHNRTLLKRQIEGYRYRFGGDTPTQRAIEQAYQQLAQEHFPAGSQVMLITDGQPDIPQDTNGAAQIHAK